MNITLNARDWIRMPQDAAQYMERVGFVGKSTLEPSVEREEKLTKADQVIWLEQGVAKIKAKGIVCDLMEGTVPHERKP